MAALPRRPGTPAERMAERMAERERHRERALEDSARTQRHLHAIPSGIAAHRAAAVPHEGDHRVAAQR